MKQEKISIPRSARWPVCVRLSMMPTVAVTAMIVLCLSGCASIRKSVTRESVTSREASRLVSDSTVSVVETLQTPVKVPMSTVSLTLMMDSLRELPAGAGYTARQGQANVKVTRRPATEKEPEQLVVEAGCDSLELLCASYSKTISVMKRKLETLSDERRALRAESKESTVNTFLMRAEYFCAGFLSGTAWIGTLLIFIKLKRK
ncbi:hypothetical protein EII32_10385 [Prevotella sp. OH937_COT-195]|nr:hypothetical protein EII32_10385 [Prevotella sp. OH937_COT-195]